MAQVCAAGEGCQIAARRETTIRAARLFIPGSRAASLWGGSLVYHAGGSALLSLMDSLTFLQVPSFLQPAFCSFWNTISYSFACWSSQVSWVRKWTLVLWSNRKARTVDDEWQPRDAKKTIQNGSVGGRRPCHDDHRWRFRRRQLGPTEPLRLARKRRPDLSWNARRCGWRGGARPWDDLEPLDSSGTRLMQPP
jgi:hypothetical protein